MTVTSAKPPQRRLVIVVQGDDAIRNSLEFALRAEGYDVASFACGEDILHDPARTGAQAFIMDHHLPDMAGAELLARLREGGASAPAIFLAGRATPAFRRQAASLGTPILDKPLIGDALRTRLASLLEQPSGR